MGYIYISLSSHAKNEPDLLTTNVIRVNVEDSAADYGVLLNHHFLAVLI